MAIKRRPFEGKVDPIIINKMRDALRGERTVIPAVMHKQHCSIETAIDALMHLAERGVVALLLQKNGDVFISTQDAQGLPDLFNTEQIADQILVDAEVQRILKGKAPRMIEGVTNRNPIEVKDAKPIWQK